MMTTDLQRLSQVLDEALAQPEETRLAWLAQRQDLDSALRDQVLRLLREEADFELPTLPQYADPPTAAGDLPGACIGPYRLVRELGHGGMGAVWLAEREDGVLKRQVALKLPHASLPRRQLTERFHRERDILASLEHPHIARLYDAGVTADGRPWLAMEFVAGRNIVEHCREQNLDLPARLQLFLQVAGALQYAHSRLVIHRDLKPNNILVTDGGEVRLLDFGIAKLLQDESVAAHRTELTQFGQPALTPQYAAPEQILGKSVGTGADVYALGLVLYELLTGALPYRVKRDTRGALEEAILEAEVQPASQAAQGQAPWAKRLRGDLDTILAKALKKQAEERYATVAAFAEDIERYRQGTPVLARPDTKGYRLGKFIRRHRWGAAATGAVTVALAAGFGVALWQAEVARTEARTAKAVQDFVIGIFVANSAQQPDPLKARQTTARELLDIAVSKLDGALAEAPEAKNRMLWLLAELYSQLLLPEKAKDLAQRRLALMREIQGPDSKELGEALATASLTYRSVWIDDPTQWPVLEEALRIFSRGSTRHGYYPTLLGFSAAYWMDRDFARAQREAREAVRLKDAKLDDWDATSLAIAAVEKAAGNHAGARDAAVSGLAAQKKLEARQAEGKAAPGDGAFLHRPALLAALAEAEWFLGEREAAEVHWREALAAAKQTFGDQDPDTVRVQAGYAAMLAAADRVAEALPLVEAASATMAAGRPEDRTRLRYLALIALGKAQADVGHNLDAAATLQTALALRDPALQASPAIAAVWRDLARAQWGLGQRAEAERALARAVAQRERAGIAPAEVLREEAALRDALRRSGNV